MAATKAELLLSALQISEPLFGHPAPPSPLDGYPKLEELQMLLHNAASAAEAAGLLGSEPSEFTGEQPKQTKQLNNTNKKTQEVIFMSG
uniref:Uncharacterized protein n=1 Tax=Xiphophorus maculatus TaxID=8083 RepID=A0A3B5Q0M5_XIPMA